jgi:hypothetical protein
MGVREYLSDIGVKFKVCGFEEAIKREASVPSTMQLSPCLFLFVANVTLARGRKATIAKKARGRRLETCA